MEFKGFERLSLIEWPGKVVAVAFAPGCNMRCPYCQNRDLIINPENIPTIKEGEIIKRLKSRRKWLDGLILSGGEPTIHSDLPAFAQKIKKTEFKLGLETNGSNFEMLDRLINQELIDYIAMDVKAPLNEEKYREVCRSKISITNIKKSIKKIKESGIDHEFRTTIVPGLLSTDDIIKIVRELKGAEKYYIQQFNPENTLDKELEKVKPYSSEKLKEVSEKISREFKKCEVRGT